MQRSMIQLLNNNEIKLFFLQFYEIYDLIFRKKI